MQEHWLERWRESRTGWHEVHGSELLRRYWPELPPGSSVLVPMCGKTVDLLWLAGKGHSVVGVELSPIAARAFFAENALAYSTDSVGLLTRFCASDRSIEFYCGDYFEFDGGPFDAVYDRGALVAVPEEARPVYAEHTDGLLRSDAFRMLITLEYDRRRVPGPPYSVAANEVRGYWPELDQVFTRNDIETGSPKFRKAGLTEVMESVWLSRR